MELRALSALGDDTTVNPTTFGGPDAAFPGASCRVVGSQRRRRPRANHPTGLARDRQPHGLVESRRQHHRERALEHQSLRNREHNIVAASALEKGANSFTESQARSRLEGVGLTNVTDLKKDDDGIWRGKATRQGKSVTVGFDYKGNIAAQ
jgi:hypothetical protein